MIADAPLGVRASRLSCIPGGTKKMRLATIQQVHREKITMLRRTMNLQFYFNIADFNTCYDRK